MKIKHISFVFQVMKFTDYKAAGNEAGVKAAGQYRYALDTVCPGRSDPT